MTPKSPAAGWPVPPIDEKLRVRLANGARLRDEMKKRLECGEEPTPAYRVEWLRQTAKEIVLVVAKSGERFNARFPEDAFSLADARDAVATARTMLLAMSGQGDA